VSSEHWGRRENAIRDAVITASGADLSIREIVALEEAIWDERIAVEYPSSRNLGGQRGLERPRRLPTRLLQVLFGFKFRQ